MQWTYVALAMVLASVTLVAARGPPGWEEMGFGTASLFQYPTEEEHLLTLHMAGTATAASTREAWALAINLTGVATRTFTFAEGGSRAAEETGELQARVSFADPETGAVVDSFTTMVQYHATRADGVAEALDVWHFQVQAPEGADAPFWFALAGDASGLEVQDGDVRHLLLAEGQASVQDPDGHRATHFHLDLTGQASEERLD